MRDIKQYMDEIGVENSAIQSRASDVVNQFQNICSEDIEDIFLSEYKKEDDSRVYESIWFFTKNYTGEAKNFRSEFGLDLITLQIEYYKITYSDYNFTAATDKSRMTLAVRFNSDFQGIFKATERNCDFLKDIFIK